MVNKKSLIIKVLTVTSMLFGVLIFLIITSNKPLEEVNKGSDNDQELSSSKLIIPTKEYILKNGFPKNEKGETYGPDMGNLILDEPVLSLTEGENGVLGYIYRPKGISSPSELEEYYKSREKSTPLYLQDGETVIGTYYFN